MDKNYKWNDYGHIFGTIGQGEIIGEIKYEELLVYCSCAAFYAHS